MSKDNFVKGRIVVQDSMSSVAHVHTLANTKGAGTQTPKTIIRSNSTSHHTGTLGGGQTNAPQSASGQSNTQNSQSNSGQSSGGKK